MNTRTYCGTSQILPNGYVNFATPSECLRKGVGVGMYLPKPNPSLEKYATFLAILAAFLIIGIVVWVIYNQVKEKNKQDNDAETKT